MAPALVRPGVRPHPSLGGAGPPRQDERSPSIRRLLSRDSQLSRDAPPFGQVLGQTRLAGPAQENLADRARLSATAAGDLKPIRPRTLIVKPITLPAAAPTSCLRRSWPCRLARLFAAWMMLQSVVYSST
jgi:hypothetical protein